MSAGMPVSVSRTRAALAVGANPITGHVSAWRSVNAGGLEHSGLASTSRADDEHEPIVSSDSTRCGVLTVVKSVVGDRRRRVRRARLSVQRPRDDPLLLGQDVLARCLSCDGLDVHRSPVG